MEPGSTFQTGYGVWLRARNRCKSWLRKIADNRGFAHTVLRSNEAEAAPVEPEAVEPEAVEVEAEPEVAEAEPEAVEAEAEVAEVKATAPKPLEEFSFTQVKDIAATLDIGWKVGVSKAALIAAIREKRNEGGTE